MVHVRSQPVQPRSSPNLGEVRPVLPTVPPQTHSSPAWTLRCRRAALRTAAGSGRLSWRTNMTPMPIMTAAATMTAVAR